MNKITKIIFVALSAILLPTEPLLAQSAEEDEINAAITAANKAPKSKAKALNRIAGDALKNAGRYAESIPYYLKGDNAANLGAAEAAYYLYDFDNARAYLDKYLEKRTDSEAQKDMNYTYSVGSEPIDWAEYLGGRIDLGRSMLDRVERIQVIDSVNVPSEVFFEFLKLARSAGSLQSADVTSHIVTVEDLDRLGIDDIGSPAFLTESGEDMIWTGYDTDGASAIYESSRLADGSWDAPNRLFDYKSIFGSENGTVVSFPFLMADGATLYFAADGEESLGNLDIFISRRDEKGFLQPSNIGMPYNSPYNDYLYAIDEQTGTGWWVSDRNGVEGMVTVYTFIPQELRNNYPTDAEGLRGYAMLSSIEDTWVQGRDYSDLKKRIERVGEQRNVLPGREFDFALPDGRVLHRLSDFRSAMARNIMKDYLKELEYVVKAEKTLRDMRDKYASGDTSLASEILGTEHSLENSRVNLLDLSNQVVNAETL